MLTQQLGLLDELSRRITAADEEIDRRLAQEDAVLERLMTIPGVGRRTAQELLAIIGTDMSRFPSHRHLASWAKLCPGLHESAGRRGPTGTGPGHKLLRSSLVESAHAASRTSSYLAAQYRRLAQRRGSKRAAFAVAHSILVIAYHLIKDGTTYQDLGPNYFYERDQDKVIRRSVQRIERFGKTVTVTDRETEREVA
jgi:transposase